MFPIADDIEAMEERAAIMEFDGGLSRAQAEAAAGLTMSDGIPGSSYSQKPGGNPRRAQPLGCRLAA